MQINSNIELYSNVSMGFNSVVINKIYIYLANTQYPEIYNMQKRVIYKRYKNLHSANV